MAAIDAEDVASLMVTVTDIQFLPAGSEDADGSWQSMTLGSPVEVNLAALPEGGESPVVIAAGALEVGDYSQVRLFVGAATIEFANAVTLGQATSFDAGTGYPVDIPSGTQTGIKTDVSFSVTDDGAGGTNAVDLVFDSGATYANVNATGSGRVSMAPVVRAP